MIFSVSSINDQWENYILVHHVLDSISNVIADRHYRVTSRGCTTENRLTSGPMNLTEYHNLTVYVNTYDSNRTNSHHGNQMRKYDYFQNITGLQCHNCKKFVNSFAISSANEIQADKCYRPEKYNHAPFICFLIVILEVRLLHVILDCGFQSKQRVVTSTFSRIKFFMEIL